MAARTVPDRATGEELVPSELVRVMLPLAAPAVVPFSQTRNDALCPAERARGIVRFEVANSLLDIVT